MLAYIEVEVKTGFSSEIVVVAVAVNIAVTPSGTSLNLHVEETTVAVVTTEEVEEVYSTISANIRVVNSCLRITIGSVDVSSAFNTECECGRDLFLYVYTETTAHITDKRRAIIERGDATAFNTYRPVGTERRSFQCLLCLRCHHSGSSNSDKE